MLQRKHLPGLTAMAAVLSASPVVAQTPVEWAAPERALVAADSFGFRVNGQQFGLQVVSVTRTADGVRFEETSTLPMASQTSVVLMSPELAMRSVEQRGSMNGEEMRIEVAYDAEHARGSALTPAGGAEALAIDVAVPAGVVDDNVLVALLPAIDWRADTDVVVPVFHSGQSTSAQMRLRVTETQTVETPAGSFEAYRVESSGDTTPLVFFVETAPAHRVLRMEITGTPVEIVRLN